MFRRRNKNKIEASEQRIDDPDITLRTRDGSINQTFPGETIRSIRQLIVQTENKLGHLPERLGVTSSISQEGVTHISRSLGTTLAHDLGSDVCIVDTNWWSPAHNARDGLGAVVTGKRNINDVILATNFPNLAYIPPGFLEPNDRAIAARSNNYHRVLDDLNSRFEYIILDLPAVFKASSTVPLASAADAICMVVHQGVTNRYRLKMALDQLEKLQVAGIVMNQVHTYTPNFLLKLLPTE